MAIVAFYTAVHLVEKLRAYVGEHSNDHQERSGAVRRNYKPIQTAYHELFNNSLIARYSSCGKFTLTIAQVKSLLVDQYLVAIEKYVSNEETRYTQPATPASGGSSP